MSRDDFQPFPAAMPPWHSCGADHVAVYGTLREGGSNDIRRFQPGIAQVGTTWLQGSLWDMGQWPGLQLDGGAGWPRSTPCTRAGAAAGPAGRHLAAGSGPVPQALLTLPVQLGMGWS
jgi:hypothetical protein